MLLKLSFDRTFMNFLCAFLGAYCCGMREAQALVVIMLYRQEHGISRLWYMSWKYFNP